MVTDSHFLAQPRIYPFAKVAPCICSNSSKEKGISVHVTGSFSALTKAAEQCKRQLQPVVMLAPADSSVGWFSQALQSVDEVRFITDGRISFLRSDTGKPINGNNKGSLLFIWWPFIKPRCMFTTVKRDELKAIGQEILTRSKAA